MPTGGGKSMLFMLPAWVGGGCTVVVVPLIALRRDLEQRCKRAGISCVEWESRRPPDEASIVLVTPESALSKEFFIFLNRQQVCPTLGSVGLSALGFGLLAFGLL
jgi:superfamily II DNA helicase RecQ